MTGTGQYQADDYGTETELDIDSLELSYAYEDHLSSKGARRTGLGKSWQMNHRQGIMQYDSPARWQDSSLLAPSKTIASNGKVGKA